MGNNETEVTSKPVKASTSQQEQGAPHPYPDWTRMQAYYNPGVAIHPPYFTSAVVPGHPPHPFVWGPQPMMPPFGTTYPAIYAPGGYPHPSSLNPHARSRGNTPTIEPPPATTGTENGKSHINTKDRGLVKKLKGLDGRAVSMSKANHEKMGGSVNSQSQSEQDPDGSSSNGSDENSEGKASSKRRTSSGDAPVEAGHPNVVGKTVASPSPLGIGKPELDIRFSGVPKPLAIASPLPLSRSPIMPMRDPVPPEHWIQDEREIKREKRKQSNRESARRSRLRKQAEAEELAMKVENLRSEKSILQSEISRLTEMSEKLRQENSAMVEKLKIAEGLGGESDQTPGDEDSKSIMVGCENLLSKLDDANSSDVYGQQESEARESSSVKLHQLLEPGPITDAVTAS